MIANLPGPKGTAESYKSFKGAHELTIQKILDLFNPESTALFALAVSNHEQFVIVQSTDSKDRVKELILSKYCKNLIK